MLSFFGAERSKLSKSVITHRVVDVVKALAGWEGVVGIDAFKPTNSQEHSNRRAKSKKRLRVESQLWVINGYLWREEGVRNNEMFAVKFVTKCII